MKIYAILFVYLLILFPLTQLSAQKTIPQGYFSPPLDINLGLTGSFSEIRPNHFHSGTDFQVQQKEGLPVYAVADGFVSRIKVSPVGFGNALYIDHPNGYTSVYAHLEQYSDTLTGYLRENQYRVKSFDVDLFPAHKKDTLYVKRGQLVGYAGNSGSSGGPHLHFELRTTVTERIINPLLFGFDIADVYPPYIDFIKIYPEGDQSFIGASSQPTKFSLQKAPGGDYRLADKDTIPAWGYLSIGAQAFDYNQNQTDRNGFYSLRMYHNYVEFFSMECDSFSFDESRYVNASIDYADNYNLGNRLVKSKKLPGNKLSFFKTDNAGGVINVSDGLLHELLISVVDLSGNMTNLRFWIQSQKPPEVVQAPVMSEADSSVFFRYDKVNSFETGDLKVNLPAGCLYDNLNFTYKKAPGNKAVFSDIHYLSNPEVPLHTRMKVSVKATKLPPRLRSKALLVRVDQNGKRSSADGNYENGYVAATTNLFDGYAIAVDTIAPTIKPWPENKKKHKTSLRFAVFDNLSGIETYRGELNGKWVLVEWDPKNKLMIYRFDFMTRPGKNTFTLYLEDEKGNKSRYSTSFVK